MKKFFKFAAIALVATGMLFSCGKDEEDNNGDNNNNQQQDPPTPAQLAVTFDNTNWDATTIYGKDLSNYNLVGLYGYKDYNDENAPSVSGYMPTNVGTFNHAQGDYYYFFYYENDNDYTIDTDGTLSGQPGAQLPNWQPQQGGKEIVTAIDLTAMTISGSVEQQCFYLPDYLNQTETIKDLNIVFTNAVWMWTEE